MTTGTVAAGSVRAPRVTVPWLLAGLATMVAATVAGLVVGPVALSPWAVVREVADHLPGIHVESGLSEQQAGIVWQLRLPRVVLGLLVGASLALAGGSYQGAFRNPLADPYLLGAGAGAGLGATLAIVAGSGGEAGAPVPLAAFVGALLAVTLTYVLGGAAGKARSPATLILAGVAIASLFTAVQAFVQQRQSDTVREVYLWILGRLTTASWSEVRLLVPYVVVTSAVLLAFRRVLDVLALGDDETTALGLSPVVVRAIVVVAASLLTAATVAVSGLIGFVGIIVPHTVRLLTGASYRTILPLSMFFGAAFLCLADLLARLALSPAEIPIGVVTAFFGAPFFLVVLRTSRRLAA